MGRRFDQLMAWRSDFRALVGMLVICAGVFLAGPPLLSEEVDLPWWYGLPGLALVAVGVRIVVFRWHAHYRPPPRTSHRTPRGRR